MEDRKGGNLNNTTYYKWQYNLRFDHDDTEGFAILSSKTRMSIHRV